MSKETTSITRSIGRVLVAEPGQSLDCLDVDMLRGEVVKNKVLFLRGFASTPGLFRSFAASFGPLIGHPTANNNEDRNAFPVSERADRASVWHSDVSFVADYPSISLLRAGTVPACGGDTMWSNTEAAYSYMPLPLQVFADNLWAYHTNRYDYAAEALPRRRTASELDFRKEFESEYFETLHPVVRVNEETHKPALLLGGFAYRIDGFSATDSRAVKQLLQQYVTDPRVTLRWNWNVGDVAIWDNASTQHALVDDFGSDRRELVRYSVAGHVPTSKSGERSQVVGGKDNSWYVGKSIDNFLLTPGDGGAR
jgi:alpha-ketoglutarate-dependent taurine dioxygenase